MNELVDFRERSARDYLHFSLIGLGIILSLGGCLILSGFPAICGLILITIGLIHFLFNL